MNSKPAARWPDWTGEAAVIVATGPSAAGACLDAVRGIARVIVIKSAWRLAPWADALYGSDYAWWEANNGCPEFSGLKVSASPAAARQFSLERVALLNKAEIVLEEPGTLGCGLKTGGGHSGFHAINLAAQWGAKRILLVGFDMTLSHGFHWFEDKGVAPADAKRMETFREALDGCAGQIKSLGIEMINCSQVSALKGFPKADLRDALWP